MMESGVSEIKIGIDEKVHEIIDGTWIMLLHLFFDFTRPMEISGEQIFRRE